MNRRRDAALLAGVALALVPLVGLVTAQPSLFVVLAVAVAAVVAFTKPLGRLVVYCGGIFVLFQSAAVPASVRAVFIVGVVLGSLVAAQSASKAAAARGVSLRRFTVPTIMLALVVVLGTLSLLWEPRSIDDWLRDASTYLLLLVAPAYGLDAALHTSRRAIQSFTIVVGFVGAFSYLIAWLSRRGQPIFGLEQFALASSLVAIPSITMCFVMFYSRDATRRAAWGAAGLAQLAMLAASGGRTAVIYSLALVAFFVAFGSRVGPWFRRSVSLIAVVAVVGAGLNAIVGKLDLSSFLVGRYDWFSEASLEAVSSDLSGQARIRAYGIMWESFKESPLLGKGFGFTYPSVNTGVVTPGTYTLDTPLTLLSKFGVLGAALLLIAVVLIVRANATVGAAPAQTTLERWLLLGGSVIVWTAQLPNGSATEQKGFAIQVALLCALSLVWAIEPLPHGDASPRRGYRRGRPLSSARALRLAGQRTARLPSSTSRAKRSAV